LFELSYENVSCLTFFSRKVLGVTQNGTTLRLI